MFYKYILPLIVSFIFALLFRQFVELEYRYKDWRRIPRILTIVLMALSFCPIVNSIVAVSEVIVFVIILCSDGEDSARIRNLKDNKFNRWLFKS